MLGSSWFRKYEDFPITKTFSISLLCDLEDLLCMCTLSHLLLLLQNKNLHKNFNKQVAEVALGRIDVAPSLVRPFPSPPQWRSGAPPQGPSSLLSSLMASSQPSKAFSSRIVHLQICLRLLQLMGSPIQSPDSQDVGGPLLLLSPPLLRHLGILLMGLSNGSWWSCNFLSYLEHGLGYCLLLLSSMTARTWMRYFRKCWSIFLGGLRVVFP